MTRLECALRRLPRDTVLILNADDPRVASLAAALPNRRLYFGMTDTAAGRTGAGPASVLPRCPRCGRGLSYSRVFTAHLGHWACPACGLQRPAPQISAAGIDPAAPVPAAPVPAGPAPAEPGPADSGPADRGPAGTGPVRMRVVTPEGASALTVALPGLENAYNALAAVAAATACGLPGQSVLAISELSAGSGRTEQSRSMAAISAWPRWKRQRLHRTAALSPGRPDAPADAARPGRRVAACSPLLVDLGR